MNGPKLLIVEDESVMGRIVKGLVNTHFPELEVLPIETDVSGAVDSIRANKPDVVVMDIQINEGTAFDVLEKLPNLHSKIIFMSAFHDYMVQALKFSAVEFVFKPFDASDMVSAIAKAVEPDDHDHETQHYEAQIQTLLENVKLEPTANKLVLSSNNSHLVVPINEVVFIEAHLSKSTFHFLKHTAFEANTPLRRFEAMLKERHFFRCHPFFLINLSHIEHVDPLTRSVQLQGGYSVQFEARKFEEMMHHIQTVRNLAANN